MDIFIQAGEGATWLKDTGITDIDFDRDLAVYVIKQLVEAYDVDVKTQILED